MSTDQQNSNAITFVYKFNFQKDKDNVFTVRLDNKTLAMLPEKKDAYPDWTELTYQQCCNCPLEPSKHKHCPIAVNVVDLIDFFASHVSDKEVHVVIETDERSYDKKTSLKSALGSIMGIYMVTSGCPIMDKLRPMVRFHLPFASYEETMFRAMSMYILAQYFLMKRGQSPDWNMDNLRELYENINIVNFSFMQRLKRIKVENASLNAIINLDASGQNIAFSLSGEVNTELQEIERLFKTA